MKLKEMYQMITMGGDAERRRKMRALTGRFACRAMSQLLQVPAAGR